MPGKTYIPRTTLAAGSNRVNSNFANNIYYNPVVTGMRRKITELENAKSTLITVNNALVNKLSTSDICGNDTAFDASLNDLTILPNYTISGEYYNN